MEVVSEPENNSTQEDTEYWIRNLVGDKKLEDEYLLGDIIGRGVSSIVYKCLRKGRTEWACKILKKNHLNKKLVQTEIRNLLELKHPNIIQIKEVFETKEEIQLVMELAQGGELFERIVERGSYSEEDAATAVRHILSALQYLHSHGIVHKDLKPENLLYQTEMDDSILKVADCGMKKLLLDEYKNPRSCLTLGYTAPEILLKKNVEPLTDMWSLGVVTYIMLCGFEPFGNEEGEAAMTKSIVEGDFDFPSPWWDEVSGSAKELISKLLSVNMSERPTAEEALNHPWTLGLSTATMHMNETIIRLKEFNAKRRFRVATTAVIATRRALSLLSPTKKSPTSDKTASECSCDCGVDGRTSKSQRDASREGSECCVCSAVDGSTCGSLASLSIDGKRLAKKLSAELSSQYKENYIGLG